MHITQNNRQYARESDFEQFLTPLAVEWGYWDVSALGPELCRQAAQNPAYNQQILETFQSQLDDIKARRGYITQDIVSLSPETPDLQTILAKFDKEHHHTDDEVRVILSGDGVFGIVPPSGEPFEIHVSAGDLLVVPAFTRHWFTLGPSGHVVALRIFKDPAGWVANYNRDDLPATASAPA